MDKMDSIRLDRMDCMDRMDSIDRVDWTYLMDWIDTGCIDRMNYYEMNLHKHT